MPRWLKTLLIAVASALVTILTQAEVPVVGTSVKTALIYFGLH